VNLFTPTELKNKRFGLRQDTKFPYEPKTTLTITKSGKYTLAIRKPEWARETNVNINGTGAVTNTQHGYLKYTRKWKAGDKVEISLAMDLRVEDCPNYTDYVAFKYGPILLAAKTTAENEQEAVKTGLEYEKLRNEYADDSRMGHSPGAMGSRKDLATAPMLIGNRNNIISRIKSKDISKLQFSLKADNMGKKDWPELTLQPFYEIQHARYSCYWYARTAAEYRNSPMAKADSIAAALDARTIDFVATGEQQSEAGHVIEATAPWAKGNFNSEAYREIPTNQKVSFTLTNLKSNNTKPLPTDDVTLMLRFTRHDGGRICSIYIDNQPLVEKWECVREHPSMDESGFFNMEFPIPAAMLKDKDGNAKSSINFRLEANGGKMAPSIFYLRLLER